MFKLFPDYLITYLRVNIKLSIPAVFIMAGKPEEMVMLGRMQMQQVIKVGTVLLVLNDMFVRKVF